VLFLAGGALLFRAIPMDKQYPPKLLSTVLSLKYWRA
jgi:hypothetical protein